MDGWESGVREREGGRVRWVGKWVDGERRGQCWMYGGIR